ncbi:hypothetical protein [Nocardia blacklockiae]|uniref:hypothetical protein n=1 Tax=Nocardia blacklockiae TaxID=480036 RepID=UPI001E29B5D0|nr:hypothetical protein [Nocardia blacklockiae]
MNQAPTAPTVLFAEPGARWRTVAYGPLLCGIILLLEIVLRSQVHWFGLVFCAALLAGFVWLQVVAGRRHVSVELTDSTLREGTETLPLRRIAEVLPEIDEESWDEEDWQSARALGELTGVPRRRKGIGLKLDDGSLVQAWARDPRRLRAELSAALERLPEARSDSEASETRSDAEARTDPEARTDSEARAASDTETEPDAEEGPR